MRLPRDFVYYLILSFFQSLLFLNFLLFVLFFFSTFSAWTSWISRCWVSLLRKEWKGKLRTSSVQWVTAHWVSAQLNLKIKMQKRSFQFSYCELKTFVNYEEKWKTANLELRNSFPTVLDRFWHGVCVLSQF